jgi:hypothetical protein
LVEKEDIGLKVRVIMLAVRGVQPVLEVVMLAMAVAKVGMAELTPMATVLVTTMTAVLVAVVLVDIQALVVMEDQIQIVVIAGRLAQAVAVAAAVQQTYLMQWAEVGAE